MNKLQEWKEVHQPYELDYHKNAGMAWCEDEQKFSEFWDKIFEFAEFPTGRMVDIGCGIRPPMGYYNPGNFSFVIDPLAREYKNHAPMKWWEDIIEYSQPAEETIEDFLESMNFVMCWNCIDHTYDWKEVLENIYRYCKLDATVAIATDFRAPCLGHPGVPKDEFMAEVQKRFRIVKEQTKFQERDLALLLKRI